MKLSLIVAVYNIETYIADCLSSCLDNDVRFHADYEVIVVNDGSTDGSLNVVNKYKDKYANVRVITQNNGGLSAARNTGLRAASGDYIWFIDGDDKIAPGAIKTILNAIDYYKTDSYIVNYSTFDDGDNQLSPQVFNLADEIFSPKNYMEKTLSFLPFMAWLTVFSKSVLIREQLCFKPGILHEDVEFSVRAFSLVETCVHIKKSCYNYRLNRTGSIMCDMSGKMYKTALSYALIEDSWNDFFNRNGVSHKIQRFAQAFISQSFIFNYAGPEVLKNQPNQKTKKYYYKKIWAGYLDNKLRLILFIILSRKQFSKYFKAYNAYPPDSI